MPETATFVFRGAEAWRNPWPSYRRLRDDAPLLFVDGPAPFWVLSRYDDVFDAVRDTATFSSAQGLVPDAGAMDMFDGIAAPIVMMDPPDHTAMRRLVSRPMTPRRVGEIEPAIQAFVDERLDRITGPTDIISALFKPLPSFVVAHFLGVPEADRLRFDGWTDAIVSANADGDVSGASATADLFAYALELIERRKAEPGDDIVSDLACLDEATASAMWIVGFIFTMVTGGNDTTTGLLGGAAELLTTEPEQRQILLGDPSLVRGSVDEFLRLTSPVQNLARTTTRPVEYYGQTIPEGHKVLLLYASANRDERHFGPSAPDLDVRREPDKMLALGYGAHHCLGAAAARLQTAVALERLLDRFPDFTVDAAAGEFAAGPYVRRYRSLPFAPG